MTTVNIQEAKTQLSALLVRVEHGEAVTIARAGTAVAQIVPIKEPEARVFGTMSFDVPDDFDAALPEEELAAWE